MTELEQKTLNAIAHISAGKALDGKLPTHALAVEVFKTMDIYPAEDVKRTLNALTKQGVISFGRTINDLYFKVKSNGL